MTRAGPMRDRIRIERRSTVQDVNGEESPTWVLVAERSAEKLAFPGREIWSSNERVARVPTVFKMRFPKSFTVEPNMRITHKRKFYNVISAIDELGSEVDLLVSCDELVGEPTS